MTVFRTCTGCRFHPGSCEARDDLKAKIKGLGVTSIKWRCMDRISRFQPGQAVWALTVGDQEIANEETGEPYRDHFPGVFVKEKGSKGLVHIKDGAVGRDEGSCFAPRNTTGFCLLPLARLEARDAPVERVCFYCSQPESLGHPDGYYCAAPANARKWVGEHPDSAPKIVSLPSSEDDIPW